MPSDFHPILLILGDADDLVALGDMLLHFSEHGAALSLTEAGVHASETAVVLSDIETELGDMPGLWPCGEASGQLRWRLSQALASEFARDVCELATSGAAAGSVTLECGSAGEVKVKVSMGEWEDQFLTDGTG